ncbi:molecular chaperone, partial [Volvox carteri f. nagariensis]
MSASEHVSVAVDYYRLLQVPRVSRPDAIRKAYETLVKQPPATAYSADTLFARAVLLKAAAESLIDPDLRRSYDAKVAAGHSALRVSQQDLPGALVVLQEIGEFQLVLDHGCRWLELNGNQPDAGDVAAAVALAYCDRAGERLTTPAAQGAVLPACDDLDAALVKLRRYGMAKQLQTQIVGALRDLAPEYACELVNLPLGPDTAARRAKGVALMRGVLRSAAAVVNVVGHARRMMQRGRDSLTCGEQVALLPDALRGTGATPHPDVLYDGALACIVEGYRSGWPHLVHQADLLLQRLDDVVRRQADALREREGLDQSPAVAASMRREHAPPGTHDMRPGLRALVTKWLQGVALASFRDTAGQPAMPLESSWFTDPRVVTYLQVWRMCRHTERVLDATHFVCNLLPNMMKLLAEVAAKAAAVAALTASRAQRIAAALTAIAAAGPTSSPKPQASLSGIGGRGTGGAAANRRPGGTAIGAANRLFPGPTAATTASAPVAAATMPPVFEAAVGTSSDAARRHPPAAATPSPFGHPYGKTLHSVSPSTATAEASASPSARMRSAPETRAPPSHGTTAGAGGAAAAASPPRSARADVRHRFAAGAAIDAAQDLPGAGAADGHHMANGHTAPDEFDEMDSHAAALRRGATEQDLRVHLAGLEAAMWDSEVPERGGMSLQRLLLMAVGV